MDRAGCAWSRGPDLERVWRMWRNELCGLFEKVCQRGLPSLPDYGPIVVR